MSKVLLEIDNSLPKAELYKFLKDNKKTLIAQKKNCIKHFNSPSSIMGYGVKHRDVKEEAGYVIKAVGASEAIPEDADSVMVDAAANTSMWCDSYMDVLLRDSAKKSIRERKGMIPHIHDHQYTFDAEVGDVKKIFYQDLPLRQLGLNQDGDAQVLTFNTEIIKSYNLVAFEKYRLKKIKQHSIGLQYIDIRLCINEPNDKYYEDEYKLWKKWIDLVINKELPESRGYFWVVPEYILLENSCVLLGANILTPTISTSAKETTVDQPSNDDTDEQPDPTELFDVEKDMTSIKFF